MIDSPSLPNDSGFGLVQDSCLIFGGSFHGSLFYLLLVQAFSRRIALSREFKGNKRQEFKIESR